MRLYEKLKQFARSESGMTMPMLAISMVTLVSFAGIGIDVARMQMLQSKLQFSLDAAGLAAGATVSTAQLETEFTKYLYANFNNYMGATLSDTTVTPNADNTVFTLSARATMPTSFMGVVGIQTISVSTNSQISRAITGLELILVLDNTGSMDYTSGQPGVTKIAALKNAATTMITTMFGGATKVSTNGKLWVGIVPFSQAVNIGTGHTEWMNDNYTYDNATTPLDWGTGNSWGGCVDARLNGKDLSDDPPQAGNAESLFGRYYWTSDNLNPVGSGSNNWIYNKWICKWGWPTQNCYATYRCSGTYISCNDLSPYQYYSPLNTTDKGPNLSCPQQITPMTNDPTILISSINAMTAEGDTVINQGLVWAWHMLSPKWRGLWGGTMNANNLPLDYNTSGMMKAVVVLTDGQNTIDNYNHGAYWYTNSNRLGGQTLDQKTQALCTAMKNANIYVYTIGLGPSGDVDTTLLSNCATASNYYFLSPSTAQLQTVFKTIGDSLSNLRVSK